MNRKLSRELRRNMTDTEKVFWKFLRSKQISNFKFRRQSPIGQYIVDFVCFDKKLIVELDGGQHSERMDYDRERSQWLESQGFKVLRFWNNDVLQNTNTVIEEISHYLTPHLFPPPQGGRKGKSLC